MIGVLVSKIIKKISVSCDCLGSQVVHPGCFSGYPFEFALFLSPLVYYFAKSSIFAKYIGHHGFRVSVSACMFFPFVCLQRLYRPHGLSDRPDSFGSRYIQFMGPCSIFTFLYRVKFKVKVTTFVKIKKNT